MQKKLPPYGKPLYELQQKGSRPANSINIWIGRKAWHKGQAFSQSMLFRTLVLPPWLSPISYLWPVKQCDVLIHDTGYADEPYVEELVYCLYMDEADKVRLLSPNYNLTVYHKE